jgi:hypothetical protein
MKAFTHIFTLLILVKLAGCSAFDGEPWHSESCFYERRYEHLDPDAMRADLQRTADYVKTLGFDAPELVPSEHPVTEARFIRGKGDKHPLRVRLSGAVRLDKPGWVVVVRVESYLPNHEGTIAAGDELVKKIDAWHAGAGGAAATR